MADPLTHDELLGRLRARVLGPEGQGHRAFLFEEVNLPPASRADALAFGLWSSRGRLVEGFEVKSNRPDWLSELKQPDKAEPAFMLADRFWLVTNPGVVQPGELPPDWGLLIAPGRRRHLIVEKEAPELSPGELDYDLLTTLLRRAIREGRHEADGYREELDERYRAKLDNLNELAGVDVRGMRERMERLEANNADLEEQRREFCQAAGLPTWAMDADKAKLAGQIHAALSGDVENIAHLGSRIDHMHSRITSAAEHLDRAREDLNRKHKRREHMKAPAISMIGGSEMRALTIQQPWATLVACGAKKVETRSWKPRRHPGVIAIHSGLKKPSRSQMTNEDFLRVLLAKGITDRDQLPLGQIVAVASVGDIVPTDELRDAGELDDQELAFGDFRPGRYGWIISDVKPLANPIRVKGKLGLWKMGDELARDSFREAGWSIR